MTDLLLASEWFNGAFVFLLGLVVVFFGITVIILVISGIGKVMTLKDKRPTVKKEDEDEPVVTDTASTSIEYEGVSPEVVAAISAVLSTYYFSTESNCEFKIKKIKRIY